jgi:GH15 family glucan-1,4-alpha-glucosidase
VLPPPAPGAEPAPPAVSRTGGRRVRRTAPKRASPATRRLGLYDYGLIGNLRSAALASRFGGIDWLCLPRFASPSVFARILDQRRGGHFDLGPVDAYESDQCYLPSANVLLTRFYLPRDRQLDLIDFMPIPDHGAPDGMPALVRIAETRGGPTRIRADLAPRMNYGTSVPEWTGSGSEFRGAASADQLWVRTSHPLTITAGALLADIDLEDGERCAIELGWGVPPAPAASPEGALRSTIQFWERWVHPQSAPMHRIAGLWHTWVERSELLLKMLSVEETGAFIAAPTASLPEWPGGTRNWDYRFAWIRDAAFCAQALLLLGHYEESERFLLWVLDRAGAEAEPGILRVMYSIEGREVLAERELEHFHGFQSSQPVRIGNAAESQFQLDIYGELLDAARLLAIHRAQVVNPYWPRLRYLTEYVVRRWTEPDHGIWENRGPPRHYVHSKVMAWVTVDRSLDLARRFGDHASVERWTPVREAIRAWVLREGFDPGSGSFVQAAGGTEIDAANLRIPLVGFLPFDDERVRGTVARVRRELGSGPFVYRYRAPDGIDGPEGSFLPAAFWLVECLARIGERRQAVAHFRRLLLAASPLGLFPEEYDPLRQRPLGNFPQAFTHIGVLRAAVALGAMEMPTFLVPKDERELLE